MTVLLEVTQFGSELCSIFQLNPGGVTIYYLFIPLKHFDPTDHYNVRIVR